MSEQSDRYFWGEGDNRKPHYMMGASRQQKATMDDITPSEESVPDCLGKLLGVRCFIPHHPWAPPKHRCNRLYSLFHDYTWTPGEEEHARCLYHTAPQFKGRVAPRRHASPGGSCECGLYAYYSYWLAWWDAPRRDLFRIFAVVSGWGDIEEHERGFRSEYMRIEALVGPSVATIRRRKARKLIERFAETYEVSVVWNPWQVHRWMDDFAGGVRLKDQEIKEHYEQPG